MKKSGYHKLTKVQLIELLEQQGQLEMELNQIFNTAADGMRVIDNQFNTLRANQTLAKMVGLEVQEQIGRKCYDTFKGPLCHTDRCPVVQVQHGSQRVELEVRKIRGDGKEIPCIVTITPFKDAEGEIIGIVEDFKDISDRKKAEQEIEQKNIALGESNITLKNVLATIEEERIQYKESVKLNLERSIAPTINKIRQRENFDPKLLTLLERDLSQLTSDFSRKITNYKLKLSPTEIKVCEYVKSGYQAKEIAEFMSIATGTVHVHKERIRKKLDLTGTAINLKSYLSQI
ncbi:MAG: PAS and helix-turn-helix domain-containing protein [Bdellovibrionales bacterium]|jgi:PAS domain S-box-containing protein|nr:PAS and helix-turn-helix domain-containing protein [Bdellovibrionales bacterium]MBT3525715.1 PAS and helix-turn-helix domain-containing protein [Bdellovibrionales bacterium]MBT7670446.1 PAS and helix-turn-helix domain-containing protein [Bdellovibrionales bacterium]MBT7766198.1 PAS and helix-turn-helix domain-containing protein [Bdellovibrionales bacterium]